MNFHDLWGESHLSGHVRVITIEYYFVNVSYTGLFFFFPKTAEGKKGDELVY